MGEEKTGGFWTTFPGVLTAIAGLITAVGGACCCRHSWTWFTAGNNTAAHERLSRIRDAAIARDRSEHPF
jgi:hypothetical protein